MTNVGNAKRPVTSSNNAFTHRAGFAVPSSPVEAEAYSSRGLFNLEEANSGDNPARLSLRPGAGAP